uniref:PiggyBac transposable element-derived protein domain-containing protein n=1 Tax=Lates calcarifer TaxID=8187 RepID=A0A4W6EU27_LATCA
MAGRRRTAEVVVVLEKSDEEEVGAESEVSDYDDEEYRFRSSEEDDGSSEAHTLKVEPHSRPSSPTQEAALLSWMTAEDPDITPHVSRFQPARSPGPQLNSNSTHTPLDLFKLFFDVETVQTLCKNTNKQAAKMIKQGKKYGWTDLQVEEFYRFVGLLLYMSIVKLDRIADYWRQNHLFSLPFPVGIMTRDRYRTISWNLHLSDPDEDVCNNRKKGTAEHDRLFQLKPLLNTIRTACKSFYHPHRDLTVDQRMVASKAKIPVTQYWRAKPTKWGFKLFVLADVRNGYTVDFSIYTGKSDVSSQHGLAYDVVMSLMKPEYLGSGFHIYMAQTPSRKNQNEVSVCSTIHPAHSGKTVQRRVKQQDGSWAKVSVPCPTPVREYNEHMGGTDLSDQFIQYYSAQHKTMRWYRCLFYHFVDVATTNSYVIHKELCMAWQTKPLSRRAFMEALIAELCGKPLQKASPRGPKGHLPVAIADIPCGGPQQESHAGSQELCVLPEPRQTESHAVEMQGM